METLCKISKSKLNENESDLWGNFELLHHTKFKEAANTTLDKVNFRQRKVTEVELQQVNILGFRYICPLFMSMCDNISPSDIMKTSLFLWR